MNHNRVGCVQRSATHHNTVQHQFGALRCAARTLLVLFALCTSADAAVIFLKGSDEPLKVRVIREDETTLVVGVPQADGSLTQRVILRTQVDEIIRSVSPERLGELSPENPQGYRNYAEELAEKKGDPDARAEAIRLYVIAAHLDPKGLARGASLGLIPLARSPREQRRFRAMAYLLDPKHDEGLLKTTATETAAAPSTVGDGSGRRALLLTLRNVRQGHRTQAQRMIKTQTVQNELTAHGDLLTVKQLEQAIDQADEMPSGTLARILKLELRLTGASAAPISSDAGELPIIGWSQAVDTKATQPVRPLSLGTLTEFDPAKNVFKDGKWVSK